MKKRNKRITPKNFDDFKDKFDKVDFTLDDLSLDLKHIDIEDRAKVNDYIYERHNKINNSPTAYPPERPKVDIDMKFKNNIVEKVYVSEKEEIKYDRPNKASVLPESTFDNIHSNDFEHIDNFVLNNSIVSQTTRVCELGLNKSYVISMRHNFETKSQFAFQQLLNCNIQPILIEAINALDWDLKSKKIDRTGAIGCLLSHRFCLQDAVLNNYNTIAIFEDDIVCHQKYTEIEQKFISNLPDDWEILWLGWNDRHNKTKQLNENVLLPLNPYGTQAMIYRGKNIIREVFDLTKNLQHWDLQLANYVKTRKCYLPTETMFDQRRHLSDIYPDMRHWAKNAWYVSLDGK